MLDSLTTLNIVILAISSFVILNTTLKRHLHILQLEDYETSRLWLFILKRPKRLQLLDIDTILLISILILTFLYPSKIISYISILTPIYAVSIIWRGFRDKRHFKEAKKKLVLTARAKRIFITSYIFSIGLLIIYLVLIFNHFVNFHFIQLFLAIYIIDRASPLWLTIAVFLLLPYERLIQNRYINDARRILSDIRPLIIGITGSYGKTGTKELLSAMLARRYNVYRPPGSYNTLMGVTRAIREGLRPYHEIFVVEMGAYRRGSIAKLCSLVHPQYGLITIIGKQHLERFGSQRAIQQAKSELVKALPPDGVAVLNGDDPLSVEIGANFNGEVRYFRVESQEGESNAHFNIQGNKTSVNIPTVYAKNIRLSLEGSDFDLHFPDGQIISVHLTLLGRSSVVNATAAAAMADRLGVAKSDIAASLSEIPPVKHRLEPRLLDNGVLILDDAFNSNPIGAKDALEILSLSTKGQRILVTPGMIELGELEKQANYDFGKLAAKSCDLAVLIGVKRIEPIKQGLIDGGFPEKQIWTAPTLKEGLNKLEGHLKSGDTILLENDLPDQYTGM